MKVITESITRGVTQHLHIILQRLRDNQLYVEFSKCAFWLKEVPFLGHVISAKGIAVDPSKIQDVLEWKSLRSVMQIRCFLRLVRYYCQNFSKIAKPMTKLLEKDVSSNGVPNVKRYFSL
jgi:hypothetical protein